MNFHFRRSYNYYEELMFSIDLLLYRFLRDTHYFFNDDREHICSTAKIIRPDIILKNTTTNKKKLKYAPLL